jgi:hypothetical protein
VEAFEAMDSPAHGSSTIHNFGRSRDQDQQVRCCCGLAAVLEKKCCLLRLTVLLVLG